MSLRNILADFRESYMHTIQPPWMPNVDPPAHGNMDLPTKAQAKRIKNMLLRAQAARRVILTPQSPHWEKARKAILAFAKLT